MLAPSLPSDEPGRLAALRALELLDTPAEERFDRITRIAQRLFDVPIALVSLIDQDRQWFKSNQGLAACETSRDISFCGHAIHADDIFVIENTLADPRFADNPLVTAAPDIRFYAGAPLATAGGFRIGTLCLIDNKPRAFSDADRLVLRDLADWVQEEVSRRHEEHFRSVGQEQEAFLRAILNTAVEGIITIDERGTVESFNPAAARIFGYPPEEVIGHNIKRLMPEPYQREHDGYLARFLETRSPRVIGIERKVIGRRKDASTFPMELAVSEVVVGGRRFFTGIVRDISARKAVEQQLHAATALQSAVLDGATYSIISTTVDGTILIFNRAAEQMLGYSSAEVIGRLTPAPFHDPQEVAQCAAALSEELGEVIAPGFEVFAAKARRHQAEAHEWTYVRKDGSRVPVLLSVTALRDAEQNITGFLGIAQDISERQKVDRMKNEFVSTVSHELRTPLTSIRGALGLVAGGMAGALPPAAVKLIEIAHSNSERLVRLINDILDIEKMESGRMQFNLLAQPLRPVLLQAIEANRAYAAALQVGIELVDGDVDGLVRIDSDRMIQVITNLLSNAAKYSAPQDNVVVAVEKRGAGLRLSVTDHGPGIPDEFRARIFQKFSQADGSDTRGLAGTGLGLAITKSLVESMGGRIGFDTSPRGTIFWVDFPQIEELKLPQTPTLDEPQQPRVLICEDAPDVANLLRMILEQGGYGADIAHDGAQARALLAQRRYVALTLDFELPGRDGAPLISELREEPLARDLPIIVVSALARDQQAVQLGSIVVADWLVKPIDHARLMAAIQRCASLAGTRPRILHVDDDADVLSVVSAIAADIGDFDHAGDLRTASQLLGTQRYDLVILDLALPDGCGTELLPIITALRPEPRVLVFSASELPRKQTERFAASLVKSVTSNADLLNIIHAQIKR